jgi:hypothetical protein
MSSDCREACEAIQRVTEGIADGDLPDGVEQLVVMLRELKGASSAIKQSVRFLENETYVRLADADAQTVTLYDGTTVRRQGTWSRTGIDREGLVEFVRNHPSATHMTSETGEIHEVPTLFAELLLRCFRQEPRWARLASIGLDDEKYCTKDFVPRLLIESPSLMEVET